MVQLIGGIFIGTNPNPNELISRHPKIKQPKIKIPDPDEVCYDNYDHPYDDDETSQLF